MKEAHRDGGTRLARWMKKKKPGKEKRDVQNQIQSR
jgi:hypothetical protein